MQKAENFVLEAKKRELLKKEASKRYRKEGLIPAVMYGHKENANILIAVYKVKYSLQEQRLLQTVDFEIPLPVHLVKKVFEGTIISIIRIINRFLRRRICYIKICKSIIIYKIKFFF